MVFKKIARVARRAYNSKAGKLVRKTTGDRYGRGSQILTKGIPQMLKDVNMLKGIINSQKKRYDITVSNTTVGQCNINASGYYVGDISPTPTENVTFNGRIGSSIKLHSTFTTMQFYHQTSTSAPINIKIYWVLVKGATQTPSTVITNMFSPNTFTSIVDYNSQLNPDYFGEYKILRCKKIHLPIDSYSGVSVIKTVQFGHKWFRGRGHHIRFNQDTTTVTDGQVIQIVLADCGNTNSATASTLSNTAVLGTSTGVVMNFDIKHYYYNN
jgi:hypothetical protein